jgi:hypothetical protein
MKRYFLSVLFFISICFSSQAQIQDGLKSLKNKESIYIEKQLKKMRRSKCYKRVKPALSNSQITVIYRTPLKSNLKKPKKEECTSEQILNSIEFMYFNSKKFPDNYIHLLDTVSMIEISREEGWGTACHKQSEHVMIKVELLKTVNRVSPDFILMIEMGYYYFLVKDYQIVAVLSFDNELVTLSDFIDKFYDEMFSRFPDY